MEKHSWHLTCWRTFVCQHQAHSPQKTTQGKLVKLLEVYVDNFVGLLQALSFAQAQKFTSAVWHGIHTIFAPPDASNPNNEPIALKKLAQGDGVWATSGWMFNGVTRCMSLPAEKVKLGDELKSVAHQWTIVLKQLHQLQGWFMHASYGILNGKMLPSLIVSLAPKYSTNQHTNIPLDHQRPEYCKKFLKYFNRIL